MRKDKLLKLINKHKRSRGKTLAVCKIMLKEFLETEKILNLGKKENIAFKDFLTFLQNKYYKYRDANVPNLFHSNERTEKFLFTFLFAEERKKPIFSKNNYTEYVYNEIFTIDTPATSLALLPNGNLLSSTCYFDRDANPTGGAIVLRDQHGRYLNTLVNEPACALAILPDGNILSSTCYFNQDGFLIDGEITLRDHSGERLKTLVREPASALAILPDGKFLSSTCYYDKHGESTLGKIVLRDQNGESLQDLVNEPASALTILPNGNILSSTCCFDKTGTATGSIVLRNRNGEEIENLGNEPSSALILLPDGNILTTTCSYQESSEEKSKIICKKPELVTKRRDPIWLAEYIEELLIDRAAMACIQFQKGIEDPTSDVAKLHRDVIPLIYSYAFPFSDETKTHIVNPNCFPQAINDTRKELLANEFAKTISNIKFFPKPKAVNNPIETNKNHNGIKRTLLKNCSII